MADGCYDCQFQKPRTIGTVEVMECRFNPPLIAQGVKGVWPRVEPNDWCSKFTSVPGPQADAV